MKNNIKIVYIVIVLCALLVSCTSLSENEIVTVTPISTNTTEAEPTYTPTITPLPLAPTLVPDSAFIEGITLTNPNLRLDSEYSKTVISQYIIPAGMNYVALSPICLGEDYNDVQIDCNYDTVIGVIGPPTSDEELVNAIQYLHSKGLRVMLKPHFLLRSDLESNYSTPRLGVNWSKTQWDEWFDNYIAYITYYAQIAENNQVDLFSIGNELEYITQREQDWRHVIAAVKDVYHGPTTYAANAWGFEASNVKFWDALDFIGTNAYFFGYVNKTDPTSDDMKRAWQPYIKRLAEMSQQYGKQIIITEVGARSTEGNNSGKIRDWDAPAYNGQEQADYYSAFFEVLYGQPWLKGIFLWDVDTNPLQGGPNDIGYSFVAKPAEQIVHEYFGGTPIISTPTPNLLEDPEKSMWIYQEKLVNTWSLWIDPNTIVSPDLQHPRGYNNTTSIRVSVSQSTGLWLNYGAPDIDLSNYKWFEFYIMVGNPSPKNLLVNFEDWSTGQLFLSRMALVNDPTYIDGGKYIPGTWQKVRIPIIDLGFADRKIHGFAIDIVTCAWPCASDATAADIYIDDIRLVAGKVP